MSERILTIDFAKEVRAFLNEVGMTPAELNTEAKLKGKGHINQILRVTDPAARVTNKIEAQIRKVMNPSHCGLKYQRSNKSERKFFVHQFDYLDDHLSLMQGISIAPAMKALGYLKRLEQRLSDFTFLRKDDFDPRLKQLEILTEIESLYAVALKHIYGEETLISSEFAIVLPVPNSGGEAMVFICHEHGTTMVCHRPVSIYGTPTEVTA